MDRFSKAGIVVLGEGASRNWLPAAREILDVISERQAAATDYRGIRPCTAAQWLELRAALYDAAPALQEFIAGLQRQMLAATAVLVPDLGLQGFSVSDRATLAYAIALCVNNPTATDKRQVIWDVRAQKRDSTYFSTFSETDGEAAFHTDTQYYPEPEPHFVLYCMEPAKCGGGYSSILDARALRRDIEQDAPWLAKVLSTKNLPFRVPSAFITGDNPNMVEATLAPVFSQTPMIRYRRDTLAAGLHYFPQYGDADVHRALDAFEEHLAKCPHQAEFFMPKDSLVLIDNHRALHARTGFQDHERHLLRIRMQSALAQPRSDLRMVRREIEASRLQTV
jgi:alpha-ketoglutarate-dependent taurine dioxygenase